jgi:hypothetical protein
MILVYSFFNFTYLVLFSHVIVIVSEQKQIKMQRVQN